MGSRRRRRKPQKSPAERVCSVGRLQRQLWPALEIIKRMVKERNPVEEDSWVKSPKGLRRRRINTENVEGAAIQSQDRRVFSLWRLDESHLSFFKVSLKLIGCISFHCMMFLPN